MPILQHIKGESDHHLFYPLERKMRITTRAVFDIETGIVLLRESYEYFGPVDFACGGPSQSQKDAANAQANLASTEAGIASSNEAIAQPFFANEVQNGLPYFGAESQYSTSNLADQVNQQKAMQKANLSGYGDALPSGFAESANRDLSVGGAKAFDQNQLALLQQQQQAKNAAAGTLLGQQQTAASTAGGANTSVMNAPLQNNFWSNVVQGVIGGAANTPFAFA